MSGIPLVLHFGRAVSSFSHFPVTSDLRLLHFPLTSLFCLLYRLLKRFDFPSAKFSLYFVGYAVSAHLLRSKWIPTIKQATGFVKSLLSRPSNARRISILPSVSMGINGVQWNQKQPFLPLILSTIDTQTTPRDLSAEQAVTSGCPHRC